jgi:hypothetical protein
MKNYLLRPTPSEVRKLRLVRCLGACIVPRIDVMLCIAAVVCLLMVGTPPCRGGTSLSCAYLNIKSTQEAYFHVVISLYGIQVGWGSVPCGRETSTCSRFQGWYKSTPTSSSASCIVGKWCAGVTAAT